jgi:hypothetical protein
VEARVVTAHVDIETGEIVRLLPLANDDCRPRKRYLFQGGYIVMGALNITRLVKSKVGHNGIRLALVMAARMSPKTGLVHCSNSEYAAELEVSSDEISRVIGRLAKVKFLHRTGPRLVTINPIWCFRGTPEQQHEAVEEWGKLYSIGIVAEERKSA